MKFNYKQLVFAREYRGYSQSKLASSIEGLSQSNLSQYEKGLGKLSNEMVTKILEYLNFPNSWLAQDIGNMPLSAHFRKRTTITKKVKSELECAIRLIGYLTDQMTTSIDWPEYQLTGIDLNYGHRPEDIAKYARRVLGIQVGQPVREICNLLEKVGVIIVEFNSHEKFDAVSFISDRGNPIIVINKKFSNDRKRFTLAHELGHLLMHSYEVEGERDKEREADRFASEFLMPEESIKTSINNLRLGQLAELKRYWLTSKQSIVRRAKDLNCIVQDHYRYLMMELSRNGGRKNEGLDVFIDQPRLFIEAFRLHKDDLGYDANDFVANFHIPNDIIERFCMVPKLRVVI